MQSVVRKCRALPNCPTGFMKWDGLRRGEVSVTHLGMHANQEVWEYGTRHQTRAYAGQEGAVGFSVGISGTAGGTSWRPLKHLRGRRESRLQETSAHRRSGRKNFST